jgi:hypothetical protein
MKVLFVEDDLAQNIPRIIRIFQGVLQKPQIKELSDLDRSHFGADNGKVKMILENSGTMDVEYTFPGAMKRIRREGADYDILIVDRQLSKNGDYDMAAVREEDSDFDDDKQVKYLEREGDYLLLQAIRLHREKWLARFYFLTAYAHDETIRSMAELQGFIDAGMFTRGQLIEKGNEEAEHRLEGIVNECEETRTRMDFWPHIEGAEQLLEHEFVREELMPYLKGAGRDTTRARPLVEEILNKLCFKIGRGTPQDSFRDKANYLYNTCVDCSATKGRPVECEVPPRQYLPGHIVQTRGWFRSAELGATICVQEAGSMVIHHPGEQRLDVRPMLLHAVRTILRRLTWLHHQGMI